LLRELIIKIAGLTYKAVGCLQCP